ncbi:MAG: TolC family protein, partial [Bacteroidota bacterium]
MKLQTSIFKLSIYLVVFILMPSLTYSQATIVTIEQCRDSAKINWPNFKKTALQNENAEVIIKTLNKNYLPKLTISGSATYQSEVVVFPEISIPGMTDFFPTFPNDNYRTDLQLLQIIYDGGNTKSAINLQLAANTLEETQTEIENYNLMDQINQLYLNILLLKKNKDILITARSEINENIKILQSAYNNGAVLVSELNKLIAEQLKIDKQLLDTEATQLN